jgi:hypothetical protein
MSDHDDLTEIKVSTARIEEQVKALSTTTTLQHKNLSEQMEKLAAKADVADLDVRVQKLEAAQGWVVKGVVGTAGAALLALSGVMKKIGL